MRAKQSNGGSAFLRRVVRAGWLVTAMSSATWAYAESDSELAQELTNPVADLVSFPIQMNFDDDLGPGDRGSKLTTNVQPVIPFSVNADWNLISRTIMPVIYQDDVIPGTGSQFGLGDVNLSLFFSPKRPSSSGLVWGAGPVFLLPTATSSKLGSEKWGAGPAAVLISMRGPWTMGALANHVWSFAGDSDRSDINSSFLQPFVSYTWPSAWTFSVTSESAYNWKSEKWSVPVNVTVSRLVRFGRLPVSIQAGTGYWLESPAGGPEGFRFRLAATLILPR
ncbi:MAG: transporter [Pseudomonadales bacterium]